MSYNDEMYHYGVKGMKWGVRRKRREIPRSTMRGEFGSTKSREKLARVESAADKYIQKSNKRNLRKVQKAHAKYDRSIRKDIRAAKKAGNEKLTNSLRAGRTYAMMTFDTKKTARTLGDMANHARVKAGEEFAYKITRSDKMGGVFVNVSNDSIKESRYFVRAGKD